VFPSKDAKRCDQQLASAAVPQWALEGPPTTRTVPPLARSHHSHEFIATPASEDVIITQQPVVLLTRELVHLNFKIEGFHSIYFLFTKVAWFARYPHTS
jgi:hypothetical protein